MTIKEIAQAVGKDEDTVQRWIKKVLHTQNADVHTQNADVDRQNVDVESIRLKAGSRDPHHPADYTLNETLIIIEAGIGPEAAGIFKANAMQEEARQKAALLSDRPLPDHRLVAALNKSVQIGAITAAQFRADLGNPDAAAAETPTAPRRPPLPPCRSLPDFDWWHRKDQAPFLTGTEAFYPPIPVVQTFINERCALEGSMTSLEVDQEFYAWQKFLPGRKVFIPTERLFKYLGLMGYATTRKNKILTVDGLSLRKDAPPLPSTILDTDAIFAKRLNLRQVDDPPRPVLH
jgi:hypothetical protein